MIRLIWKRLFGINNLATWINALNQNPNQIEQIFGSQLQKCCLTYSRSTFQWAAHAFYFLLHKKMEYIFLCKYTREKKKLPKLSSPLQAVFITKSFAALIISSQILSWLQYNGDFFVVPLVRIFCTLQQPMHFSFTSTASHVTQTDRIFFNSLACLLSSLLSKVF